MSIQDTPATVAYVKGLEASNAKLRSDKAELLAALKDLRSNQFAANVRISGHHRKARV